MFKNEQLREFINFPLGICQFPDSTHAEVRAAMVSCTGDKFANNIKNYQPAVVFPFFNFSKSKPENEHKALYVAKLRTAIDLIHACGIVHLDLRVANILWNCSCLRNSSSNSSTCDFQLKIIDFEHAFFIGDYIDPSKYNGDKRYPYHLIDESKCATIAMDDWFFERIVEFLDSIDCADFDSFCEDFDDLRLNK